jgi:hypothetical protein
MDFRQLNRGELIAAVGGIVLAISVFLSWYSLGVGAGHTTLNTCHGGAHGSSCSAWNALSVMRFLFLLGAIAPVILAWIIARGHALAWPRGELTAVVAVVAIILVLFRGIIDKPGDPPGQISVDYGWGLALVGTLLMLAGAVWRSQESAPRRKPPGVL